MTSSDEIKSFSSVQYKLKLHPLDDDEFIGSITIPEDPEENKRKPTEIETIIILDKSGSMGDVARRVANEILPLFLSKLSVDSTRIVHLITFESVTNLYSVTSEEIKKLPITGNGGTVMTPAVQKIHKLFQSLNSINPVRVLTISDGIISDQAKTSSVATEFMQYLKTQDFTINSQAVRLFTSASQPDTTALCSLLQINNTTTSQLADIAASESVEDIATKMALLFKSDGFEKGLSLSTNSKTVFKFPWESDARSKLTLVPGDNLLWFKTSAPNDTKVDEVAVKVETQAPLTLFRFQALITSKLSYIVDHMKILKVVGTQEANDTVDKVEKYFQLQEDKLTAKSLLVKYFNITTLHKKKISNILSPIAKDTSVKGLSLAEKAEYLRKVEFTVDDLNWIEKLSSLGFDIDDVSTQGLVIVFVLLFAIFIKSMF